MTRSCASPYPGFAGREAEAIARIFSARGVAELTVPTLLPEFDNPLFLILYCDAIAGGRIPPSGAAHLTAVLDAFVADRTDDITAELRLDSSLDQVGKAVRAIAAEIARRGGDHLPYEQAHAIVESIAPSRNPWA